MTKVLTSEAIRERMSRIGKTQTEVARELGVSVAIVRGVLSGHFKGTRGDAHKVAVALGLKDGVIIGDDTPIAEAIRKAAA